MDNRAGGLPALFVFEISGCKISTLVAPGTVGTTEAPGKAIAMSPNRYDRPQGNRSRVFVGAGFQPGFLLRLGSCRNKTTLGINLLALVGLVR